MSSRLLNVRLDEDRLRKAQMLRKEGFVLSDVVRQAIDDRFDQLIREKKVRDVRKIVLQIFEQHPDPTDLPPRNYDVHDRKGARRAILDRLSRGSR